MTTIVQFFLVNCAGRKRGGGGAPCGHFRWPLSNRIVLSSASTSYLNSTSKPAQKKLWFPLVCAVKSAVSLAELTLLLRLLLQTNTKQLRRVSHCRPSSPPECALNKSTATWILNRLLIKCQYYAGGMMHFSEALLGAFSYLGPVHHSVDGADFDLWFRFDSPLFLLLGNKTELQIFPAADWQPLGKRMWLHLGDGAVLIPSFSEQRRKSSLSHIFFCDVSFWPLSNFLRRVGVSIGGFIANSSSPAVNFTFETGHR